MEDKSQLTRRSCLVFFFIGVVALGSQLSGVMLPFWLEDNWKPLARSVVGMVDHPSIRIYHGLWTDYRCEDAYMDGLDVIGRDCHIHLMSLGDDQEEPLTKGLKKLRILEVLSLGFGLVSVIGVISLYVTSPYEDCRRLTSQCIFSFFSLAAGFLAMMGVLMLTAELDKSVFSWGLIFPTAAGFFWLANGAFSFVICRYHPQKVSASAAVLMETYN